MITKLLSYQEWTQTCLPGQKFRFHVMEMRQLTFSHKGEFQVQKVTKSEVITDVMSFPRGEIYAGLFVEVFTDPQVSIARSTRFDHLKEAEINTNLMFRHLYQYHNVKLKIWDVEDYHIADLVMDGKVVRSMQIPGDFFQITQAADVLSAWVGTWAHSLGFSVITPEGSNSRTMN